MKNPLQLIDKRSLAVMLGSILVLTLASVIIIVLTLAGRNDRAMKAEMERREREQQAFSSGTNFGLEDFQLEYTDPDAGVVYPVRQPVRTWSRQEVAEFWIDPAEAGLETLSGENDKLIFRSLGLPGPGTGP